MSDSIHQWILKDLKQYAEVWGPSMGRELMRPPKGRKCQLVKFIKPPTDDPSAAIWGRVSDKECWIPVRFDPKTVVLFDSQKDHEPLGPYHLGSVCTIRKITLIFTKVPLDGKIGLSKEDRLVLSVREVTIHGARGEPAFCMDVKDKKGLRKRGESIFPHEDPVIGRWEDGLRTGNGHVLQIERGAKNEKVELEDGRSMVSLTPPATPRASTSRIYEKETRKVSRHEDWIMPADQKELIERYNGRGPPTPASDVFSDEESEEEGPGINNPNLEQPSSPATVIYSGWSSTPARAPAFARGEDDEDEEEGDDADSDVAGDENTLGGISSGELIPCAQPPKADSTFSLTLGTPEEEPLPPTAVPPVPEVSQSFAELPLSWPTFPSTFSKDPENTDPEQKDRDSQLSAISTIEPTSSNDVSCSALCPPAQRSFAKVDDSPESHQDTGSQHSSVSSFQSAVQSQLSDVGIAGSIVLEDDDEAEVGSASPRAENEGGAEIPLASSPPINKRPSPSPHEPKLGSVFDDNKLSSITPPDRGILSSKLDDLQLPKCRRPDMMQEPTTVLPLVRDGHGMGKRRRSELKTSVEGPNKRLKSDQAARRETTAASLYKNASVTPRASDSFFEENRASSSKNVPKRSEQRRPLLVGNGNDLTLWRALQKNPPPPPQVLRPSFLLPDYSAVRPPLLDLRKMKPGVRRSEKYRKSQDLSQ